jgi:hypothetical protein
MFLEESEAMTTFDYNRFLGLNGSELYAYVEPFMDPACPLAHDVLKRMLKDMFGYDEAHLVFSVELGPDHAPDLFAPVVPHFLSHESRAVRCSVSRAIGRLPDRLITTELVDAARMALETCPAEERATWTSFVDELHKRSQRTTLGYATGV